MSQQLETKQLTVPKGTPFPDRIRGTREKLLRLLSKGALNLSDAYEVTKDNPSTVRAALYALGRYGLAERDGVGCYSLTILGSKYMDILSGQGERREAARRELGFPPSPHFDVWQEVQKELDQARSEQKRTENVRIQLIPSSVAVNPPTRRQTIKHDLSKAPTKSPDIIRGRGESPSVRFVPLSDNEKKHARDMIRLWGSDASEAEYSFVHHLFAATVLNPDRPWNQKVFDDTSSAAQFFDLSVPEFDLLISSLRQKGVAYCYDTGKEKKVGLYLSWLDKMRGGAVN